MDSKEPVDFSAADLEKASSIWHASLAKARWAKLTKAQRKASLEKSWKQRKINHPPKSAAK